MEGGREEQKLHWVPPPVEKLISIRPKRKERAKSMGSMVSHPSSALSTWRTKGSAAYKGMPPRLVKKLCPVDKHVTPIRPSCGGLRWKKKHDVPEERRPRVGKICLEGCRYEIIRAIALEVGFTETTPDDLWNIMWSDVPVSIERPLGSGALTDETLKLWRLHGDDHYQRANHFPGTVEYCRKDSLSWNLERMTNLFPDDFKFYPKTWHLPADYDQLYDYVHKTKETILICKPEAGAQGKGIFLTKNMCRLLRKSQKLVVQLYIPNPLLIDGFKFDLRIYVLITCYDPLRIYVYNEGLARFATMKYRAPTDANIGLSCMHLTNYFVNKFSDSYVEETGPNSGSKRKLSDVFQSMLECGYDVVKLIQTIDDIIIKTIMSSQPAIKYYYKNTYSTYKRGCACFEVVGFDILLDSDFKPWLLEVNLSPSYVVDLVTDSEVKEQLLRDTFYMIHLGEESESVPLQSPPQIRSVTTHADRFRSRSAESTPPPKDKVRDYAGRVLSEEIAAQFKYEAKNSTNYRIIYPIAGCENYKLFLALKKDNLFDKSPALNLLERTPEARATKSRISRSGISSFSSSVHL